MISTLLERTVTKIKYFLLFLTLAKLVITSLPFMNGVKCGALGKAILFKIFNIHVLYS